MASVTGVTAEAINDMLDEMLVSVEVDDSGQLIYTKRSGEQFNAGSLTDADLAVSASWPVSSIFISVVPTNPNILLGIGTWTRFAQGRMLVGLDEAQTEFDAVLETGGAKTVTLTEAQIPAHWHQTYNHYHTFPVGWRDTGPGDGFNAITQVGGVNPNSAGGGTATGVTSSSGAGGTDYAGGGGAHQNLPPYIVVYMWRRTA